MDFIRKCQTLVNSILQLLLERGERPAFSKLFHVLSGVKHHLDHLADLCRHAALPTAEQRPWIMRWVLHDFDRILEECKTTVARRDLNERKMCWCIQRFAVEGLKLRTVVLASSWKACLR
ncbi:hypothetical protein SLS54_004096 [Diplodia seriata]